MKIIGARQNRRETILEIIGDDWTVDADNPSAKQEGADLGKFLRKFFGIKEESEAKK